MATKADPPKGAASRKRRTAKPPVLEADVIHIFTDGSALNSDWTGGWGCVLIWPEEDGSHTTKEYCGGERDTTVNRMELMGILNGLKKRLAWDVPTVVYSDSQLCVNTLSKWWKGWKANGWKTSTGEDVANLDLIKRILKVTRQSGPIRFIWIKGHSGKFYNEKADELANKGRLSLTDKRRRKMGDG